MKENLQQYEGKVVHLNQFDAFHKLRTQELHNDLTTCYVNLSATMISKRNSSKVHKLVVIHIVKFKVKLLIIPESLSNQNIFP
jgi:hypothetical protein